MPYTIRIINPTQNILRTVAGDIEHAIQGQFTAKFDVLSDRIEVRMVRLTQAKPYCGQHPGPCQNLFSRKRRNSKCLEADDWIRFHGVVNDVLDDYRIHADVWSRPQDNKGKLWIRKADLGRRYRWDYHDDGTRWQYGQEHNVWDPGTPSQFIPYLDHEEVA